MIENPDDMRGQQATNFKHPDDPAPHPGRWAIAIMVSAAFRVAGPWFWPQANRTTLMVSAVGWSLAFALYVIVNGGILMTPRPDGKEG